MGVSRLRSLRCLDGDSRFRKLAHLVVLWSATERSRSAVRLAFLMLRACRAISNVMTFGTGRRKSSAS